MFFKKSASANNQRRRNSARNRSRSSNNSRSGTRSKKKTNKREIEEKTEMLHAQIGALEDFIAGSPFRDRRQRFQSRDTVPPPERMQGASRRRQRGEPSRRELQAMRRERLNHLLTFAALFASVCAMLYWLLQMID